jgi:photosystem II stability/assembly factor-like uncharacterized protein
MKKTFTTILFLGLIGILNLAAQVRVYAPQLSLPENGSVNKMPDVVLDWNAVTGGNTGIIQYQVQLDTNASFPTPVVFETEFLTAVQMDELIFGETYYWRVRAVDGADVSDWSETWSFTVIRRVVLNKPTDASMQSTEVTLQWNAITGILNYDYQFDTTFYWTSMASGQTSTLNGVVVVDSAHAWAVGASGKILFYDGASWNAQTSGTTKDLYSVCFLDTNNGWAVGKSGTICYFNGTQWSAQTSDTNLDLNGVHFINPSSGWNVSKGGVIQHFDGTAWTIQDTSAADKKDLYKVFAVDDNHVWAVGKSGVIVAYDGSSWTAQESGTTKDINGIYFNSSSDGWVVGKIGLLEHYSNGTWTILEQSLTTKDLNSVWFTSPDNAWAVGKTGTFLQYDGVEWFSQSGGTAVNLNSVSFSGNTGFAVGETGVLISYNNDAFSSPLAVIYNVPGDKTATEIINLLFGEQYFWRMRTRHALAQSEWSGARSFSTKPTVTLDKPETGSADQNLDVLLKWDKYSELVTYDIEIDEDPAFGSPVFLTSTEISVNAEQLLFGVNYNWRVRALHVGDVSDWSEVWTLSTVNTVTLTSPTNNEANIKLSPLLEWTALTGILEYEVNLASDAAFTDILVESIIPATESSFIVPIVLEKNTNYFWRVKAVNGLDSSNWSSVWSFVTIPPVGIDEPGLAGALNIYPNPVNNNLYIQLTEKKGMNISLSITDLLGKTVLNQEFGLANLNETKAIEVSNLRDGIYMLRISDGSNTYTRKIIINR